MAPSAPVAPSGQPRVSGGQTGGRGAPKAWVWVALFAGVFAALLASFPARNLDFWQHLADARDLVRGNGPVTPFWLYDLALYAGFSLGGGVALAAAKALLCGAVAVLMVLLCRDSSDWRIPLAVLGLAVLATGTRLLLQPETVSLLFLALTVWLLRREESRPAAEVGVWPGWRFVVLFALWANVDSRFVLGLGVVALAWLGRLLDAPPPSGFWPALGRRAAALAILVLASCASPSHVRGLTVLPLELRDSVNSLGSDAATTAPVSPFGGNYFQRFQDIPAGLAYYPLLGLSLLSLLLNRKQCPRAWLFPLLGLTAASAIQARLVPYFAVLAGPVTAWNFQAYFAARGDPVRGRLRYAVLGLPFLLAAAFLVSAWPGWLQGPPYQPRRWAVEVPAAYEDATAFLRRAHAAGVWPKESRTLHASPDTAAVFAWFCPEDRGLRDDGAVEELVTAREAAPLRERLRALGVSRVVAYEGDDKNIYSLALMDRLLADPAEWPVLHMTGGMVVFGWRDPDRATGPDPYTGREVNFARLAFRPTPAEAAPGEPPQVERRWTDQFWKPAPPARPPGRDEATFLLRQANAALRPVELASNGPVAPAASVTHQYAWLATQVSALAAAAGPPGAFTPADAAVRAAMVSAPIPESVPPDASPPPAMYLALAFRQLFAVERGYSPAGTVYAAIRAARRAVAVNPSDADAYFALGRAYGTLVRTTSEKGWTRQLPDLYRLRQIQASAALNRAVALNPRLAAAHLELARLYLEIRCHDLAAVHLRAYLDNRPRGGTREEQRRDDAIARELSGLTEEVGRQTRELAREGDRIAVGDRAVLAARRGLAGAARDLLLKSDFAAFGVPGLELEFDLLLQTGRPDLILKWTEEEKGVKSSLGDLPYHWTRAQAHAALGDYDAADGELDQLTGPGSDTYTPEHLADFVGGLIGKAILDEQPGNLAPARVFLGGLSRNDVQTQVESLVSKLRPRVDLIVVRGLVALEAGAIDRSRGAFRAALRYAPAAWGPGQLEFGGRWVARACLALIDDPALGP